MRFIWVCQKYALFSLYFVYMCMLAYVFVMNEILHTCTHTQYADACVRAKCVHHKMSVFPKMCRSATVYLNIANRTNADSVLKGTLQSALMLNRGVQVSTQGNLSEGKPLSFPSLCKHHVKAVPAHFRHQGVSVRWLTMQPCLLQILQCSHSASLITFRGKSIFWITVRV